jgi:uncharacterized protein YggU (UPF0235/DUF167 family)
VNVRAVEGAVVFDVLVQPRASRDTVVAKQLDVANSAEVIAGTRSRRRTVRVAGVAVAAVEAHAR